MNDSSILPLNTSRNTSSSDLPQTGSVLGIDVGFSPTRRSSALCRLDWDQHSVRWNIRRFRATHDERCATINAVVGDSPLLAAGLDGPLRAGFNVIGHYRVAERMLTRRLGSRIGKPGQASAPVGKLLNAAANECASVVVKSARLGASRHHVQIDHLAIVEAFPSSFLGVMLADPSAVTATRGDRSDTYFKYLAGNGELERLTRHLLPGRTLAGALSEITNHDDRAGLVCALTALSVAANDYTAVGDSDGWIVLPSAAFIQDWAWADLKANASAENLEYLYQSTLREPALD